MSTLAFLRKSTQLIVHNGIIFKPVSLVSPVKITSATMEGYWNYWRTVYKTYHSKTATAPVERCHTREGCYHGGMPHPGGGMHTRSAGRCWSQSTTCIFRQFWFLYLNRHCTGTNDPEICSQMFLSVPMGLSIAVMFWDLAYINGNKALKR